MRIVALSLAALCCVFPATPGVAQKVSGDTIAADQIDIGKVQTRILKYDQALGVVTPAGAEAWRKCRMQCRLLSPKQQQTHCMALRAGKEM